MTRNIIALIGFVLLAGCSGGGGDSATPSSAPAPLAQPDMLTATPAGLQRGKANGQGQRLIFSHPNLHQQPLLMSEGNVVYSRTISTFDNDIWTVRTDGTGDRAVVNTKDGESISGLKGPWMLYKKFIFTPLDTGLSSVQQIWSVRLDTGAQFLLANPGDVIQGWDVYSTEFYGTDRVMFETDPQLFSSTVTGADPISHATINGSLGGFLYAVHITEYALIYLSDNPSGMQPGSQLFTVPLAGGNRVPLDSDQFSTYFKAAIGNRIVYHRSGIDGNTDVVSIDADGTDRVVLASRPANEAVQGVTTSQVIIRRNLAGNDQLIAVPVAGGAEKLLMTMTDSEFVDTIVGDVIVVRRPSGTWTLNLSGTLKQLDSIAGLDGFVAVGNAICSTNPVWCMPLDGSATAVKIADEGKVVGAL